MATQKNHKLVFKTDYHLMHVKSIAECSFSILQYFGPSLSYQSSLTTLSYLCLVFVMLSFHFIAALWSPAGKGLTSWLPFVMFNCGFVTFPCGILGQVWYLIVLIPHLCPLSYFYCDWEQQWLC